MLTAKKLIAENLSKLYSKQEIESFTRLILEKVTGLSRLQQHLNQKETISSANLVQIKEIINRLILFEPIQYILGETEFFSCTFKVNPAVLIPRPETEELVDWIIKDCIQSNPVILDIGTGSGCIPISLAKNLTGAAVSGCDISNEALSVAKENATRNQVNVDFFYADILQPDAFIRDKKYDIIVSNPPYITSSEKSVMSKNVTDYEPHIALFVPDTDSLIFYRAIANFAKNHLNSGGNIYFEINEHLGDETTSLLKEYGFKNIVLRKDINGKDRMIRAQLGHLEQRHIVK